MLAESLQWTRLVRVICGWLHLRAAVQLQHGVDGGGLQPDAVSGWSGMVGQSEGHGRRARTSGVLKPRVLRPYTGCMRLRQWL